MSLQRGQNFTPDVDLQLITDNCIPRPLKRIGLFYAMAIILFHSVICLQPLF